ncbi:MAG: polyamine aminopropyltransferase [Myxococcota bacterium]
MSRDDDKRWVYEEQPFLRMGYPLGKVLFDGQSPFQKVAIYETASHGRMLFSDGMVMMSERDEFVYHEMIAHVPLFVHPNPRQVLVIGGGDGGTAREVMRHPSVERCVMVEIDQLVIGACKAHIWVTAQAFYNNKMELHVEDRLTFVADAAADQFDVVIVDATEPVGPATSLFGEGFYRDLQRVLTADGIVVSPGASAFYHAEQQAGLVSVLAKVFPVRSLYNFTNLTSPGGLWSFTFASNGRHPLRDFDAERVAKSGLSFQYYTPEIHRAAFALPQFQRDRLDGLLTD